MILEVQLVVALDLRGEREKQNIIILFAGGGQTNNCCYNIIRYIQLQLYLIYIISFVIYSYNYTSVSPITYYASNIIINIVIYNYTLYIIIPLSIYIYIVYLGLADAVDQVGHLGRLLLHVHTADLYYIHIIVLI